MTAPATTSRARSTRIVLIVLAGLTLLAAILTPEAVNLSSGNRTTYTTGPGGARVFFELARRLGWNVERRLTPLDSGITHRNVAHALLAPPSYLGAQEVHRLLEHVRRGGSLIFTMDGGEQIADSLGLGLGDRERTLHGMGTSPCPAGRNVRDRSALALPPEVRQIVWRRPPPSTPDTLMATLREEVPVIIGFSLGAGRVAAVSSSDILANEVLRVCEWNADVAAARVLEYVRPAGVARPRMMFDEYHHGYGEHGGSFAAVGAYFSRTGSGRFLAQLLLAGFVLVLARAPRPVLPRETERIARRSPLEHADALGHAYSDVRATRTAVKHLVSGVRRRVGRAAGVGDAASDERFLISAAERFPAIAPETTVVRRGLNESVDIRDMPTIGAALTGIEDHLLAQIKKLS